MSVGSLADIQILWLSIVMFPLVMSLSFLFSGLRRITVKAAGFSVAPALVSVFCFPTGSSISFDWLFFSARMGMDAISQVFLLFSAVLWLCAAVYSSSYLSDKKHHRYFVWFFMAMSGNFGLIIAQDVFTFYFLFALMSFASYGLVVHADGQRARYAGMVYIMLVVIGEAFIFSAMLMASHAAGSLLIADLPAAIAASPKRGMILLFGFIGFGIKAGALPLHVWLPMAHPVAPTPASAVLSGSMIKAGLIGWIRIFPLGVAALTQWGEGLIIMGLIAAFYGVAVGLTQKEAKQVLAYSSISQMGVITVILGLCLLDPDLWASGCTVIMLFAAHHAMAKGALFLSVGVAKCGCRGIYKGLMSVCLALPALALIGFPMTSGDQAKSALKGLAAQGIYQFPELGSLKLWLSLSTLATGLIMLRFLFVVWPKKDEKPIDVKPGMIMSWIFLVGIVVVFPYLSYSSGLAEKGLKFDASSFDIKNVWPILAAFGAFLVMVLSKLRFPLVIPEGDVIKIYEKFIRGLMFVLKAMYTRVEFLGRWMGSLFDRILDVFDQQSDVIDDIADRLGDWRTFGIAFLSIVLLIIFLLPY